MKPLSALFSKLLRRFSDMEPRAVVGGEEGWRFVLRHTGSTKLAVVVMLVLSGYEIRGQPHFHPETSQLTQVNVWKGISHEPMAVLAAPCAFVQLY